MPAKPYCRWKHKTGFPRTYCLHKRKDKRTSANLERLCCRRDRGWGRFYWSIVEFFSSSKYPVFGVLRNFRGSERVIQYDRDRPWVNFKYCDRIFRLMTGEDLVFAPLLWGISHISL